MEALLVWLGSAFWFTCLIIGTLIGNGKDRRWMGFCLSFALGPIGVVITIFIAPGPKNDGCLGCGIIFASVAIPVAIIIWFLGFALKLDREAQVKREQREKDAARVEHELLYGTPTPRPPTPVPTPSEEQIRWQEQQYRAERQRAELEQRRAEAEAIRRRYGQ